MSHKWPSLKHKVDNERRAGHVETKASRELSFRSALLWTQRLFYKSILFFLKAIFETIILRGKVQN